MPELRPNYLRSHLKLTNRSLSAQPFSGDLLVCGTPQVPQLRSPLWPKSLLLKGYFPRCGDKEQLLKYWDAIVTGSVLAIHCLKQPERVLHRCSGLCSVKSPKVCHIRSHQNYSRLELWSMQGYRIVRIGILMMATPSRN